MEDHQAVDGAKQTAASDSTGRKRVVSAGKAVDGTKESGDDMPDSVLWVCKKCLTGGHGAGAHDASAGGKATRGQIEASLSGGTDSVATLRAEVKNRDIAVRLLARELRNAGLPLPVLPAGVAQSCRLSRDDVQVDGHVIARLVGSFRRDSSMRAGPMNATAQLYEASSYASNRGKISSSTSAAPPTGSRCMWFKGGSTVYPET